ncbi:hypothetical protein NXU86_08355 [Phocaeicola vulgatus]|nr:hypothetical protein [Phocaeicola vulgatus]
MKYGTVIRLLTVACLAIVQLTGCSSDVEEMEEAAPGIPIRIVAEMNRGGRYFPDGRSSCTFIRRMERELYRCRGI